MNGDLTPYLTGEMKPSRQDRAVVGQARQAYNRARKASTEVDAVMALGGHIMERTVVLDALRRGLACGDEQLNAILGRVELETIAQAQHVQKNMASGFGF